MLTLLLVLLSADTGISFTSTESGVAAAALSGTPTMTAINMEATRPTNQLSLTLAVTPGTSLIVDVRCYESQDGTNFEQIAFCDNASPKSTCVPDVRTFTLASYSGTVKRITSRWPITKKYAKCSADDPADGNGTVTVTGVRSYR